RWARHLGAVQVSSNPVIAARAYEEIADLWKSFEIVASAHPEWQNDPEKFADEIALYGTVNSLLPNILDFRPIALLSNFKDGMVSIQLNPRKAGSVEGSLEDALKFYSILREILERYDAYLAPNSRTKENARPNIVFKVSTSGDDGIRLTESLDKRGIGTNNTVTFTVAQEIRVALVAMRGLADALKAGIPITTIYITNMEGRLEDYLREVQGSKLLAQHLKTVEEREARISSIAQKVGAIGDLKNTSSAEQQINLLCSKKYLKSLGDDWFVEALGRENVAQLKQMEGDIRMSGIYVTRRVFQLLFKSTVNPTLVQYLKEQFGLSEVDASKVVNAVDLLPASKRRAEDTYLVLADKQTSNLTNTEFPDHQMKVLQKSRESGFQLDAYENSIAATPDQDILQRLLEIPDFQKAYEMNLGLVAELNAIGIAVPVEKNGVEPEEWASYGPVRKTMDEFTGAYVSFQAKLLGSVKKVSSRKEEISAQAMAK
ncbi:MAG: transaldolase family protein, partial [Nitrososphaerales archaeon]